MNASPTLDDIRPASDERCGPSTPPTRSRPGTVGRAGGLLAAFVVAGALFWGAPVATGGGDDLPDPEAMALLGDGHNSSADNVSFWSERVAAVPTSSGFRTQLAAAQLALAGDIGDLAGYEVAEQTAARAVAATPTDASALLVLAAARAAQHDFSGALLLAERVLSAEPGAVGALLAAGDARMELGDYVAARGNYDEASRLVGGEPAVLSRFARLESIVGSPDRSIELARDALIGAGDIDLRRADAAFYWFQLATFEYRRGEYGDANQSVRNALTIDPANSGSRELLARILVAQGAYGEATAVYEDMVAGGGGADLHGELAKLYALAGRDADAAAQVELGLAVAASQADRFPAERRHLIGFLVDHDPVEALRLAELDLAQRQDVYAHAWYAWSLHRSGRFAEAAEAIVPALTFGTQDAWLLYQAGAIYASVGDTERAKHLLSSALAVSPEFDLVHAEAARALLAAL